MKIANIQFPVFVPYNKSALEIYISGCKRHCKNCCNPELQNFKIGENFSKNHLDYIKERKSFFDVIAILGGDLLDQNEHFACKFSLQLSILFENKELWLFTGHNKEEIPDWVWEIFDYVKIGEYKEELKQDGFPASFNQKLLKKGRDY